MRYVSKIMIAFFAVLLLAGCSTKSGARKTETKNSVEKALEDQIASADTEQTTVEDTTIETEQQPTEPPTSDVEQSETERETELPELSESEDVEADTESEAENGNAESASDAVDYDLTNMNSDMVYATVYQMMVNPEPYVGKTVKMSGPFYPYTNLEGTVYYPACIIEDALACCAQGMEFALTDGVYPDDYPEWGTVITVTGTFETYEEDEYLLCHLVNATLIAGNP